MKCLLLIGKGVIFGAVKNIIMKATCHIQCMVKTSILTRHLNYNIGQDAMKAKYINVHYIQHTGE
jgi:hypothetical protein